MITDIYKVHYMKHEFAYVGLLRNEKLFNINDNVFFSMGNEIAKGIIVGVELPPDENPEYRYKIRIPKELCKEEGHEKFRNLICDHIFSCIDDAKDSAIKNLDIMTKLQRAEIDRYFKQFNNEQ